MDGALALRPDERSLWRDLAAGRFLAGQASGRWRLVAVRWPHALITVTASDGEVYGLRFECTDYPATAVTAQPWDHEADCPLPHSRWPKGASKIALAFNPAWKEGRCLYLPCDRLSIEGHDNWRSEHPAMLWDPARGICKYLGIVYQLLNCGEYGGRRG